MSDVVWETTHSVDSRASLAFAWAYMTNVTNWDDPPATFELEGPFAAGSRGVTRTPGQEPRYWQVAEVKPFEHYVLATQLDGASMSFQWSFGGLADGGTCLTQHITLRGTNAAAYVPLVEAAFGANLEPGMNRIASAMERAESGGRAASSAPCD